MRSFIVTIVQVGHQGVLMGFMAKTHGHFQQKKHVFVTKSNKFGRTEVSIPPMESSRRDLSIQRVVKGWFLIFGTETLVFHEFFGRLFKEKPTFSSRNRSGRGFMSSRWVGITA